jgi:hypothetical protein
LPEPQPEQEPEPVVETVPEAQVTQAWPLAENLPEGQERQPATDDPLRYGYLPTEQPV